MGLAGLHFTRGEGGGGWETLAFIQFIEQLGL
jgi:hypothetical protein